MNQQFLVFLVLFNFQPESFTQVDHSTVMDMESSLAKLIIKEQVQTIERICKENSKTLKLRCDNHFQRACSCVFKVITLIGSNPQTKVITLKTQLHAVNAR